MKIYLNNNDFKLSVGYEQKTLNLPQKSKVANALCLFQSTIQLKQNYSRTFKRLKADLSASNRPSKYKTETEKALNIQYGWQKRGKQIN